MSGYLDAAVHGVSVQDGSELRTARNGTAYVRVGVDHGEGTVWVTAFGAIAEAVAGTINRGDRVYAVGQLTVKLLERDGRSAAVATMIARRLERMSVIGDEYDGNEKRARPKQDKKPKGLDWPKPQRPTKAKQGMQAPIEDRADRPVAGPWADAAPFNDDIPF